MAGTSRVPTQDDYNAEALRALSAMTPAERARQQFVNTLTNFGDTVSFGGVGALGDLARGTPIGTTGTQVKTQRASQSPEASAVSTALGYLTPASLLSDVARPAIAAAGGLRAAGSAVARSFVPEVIGTRAAALGAKATLPVGRTITGFAVPAAVAGAVSGLADRDTGAGAVPIAVAPAAAANPVANALAQGRAAAKEDPQNSLATAISTILSHNPSIADVQAAGNLVPAAVKPTGTQRDMVFGSAYQQSKAMADAQVAALQAQAAAGTITPAQRDAAITKTLQTHFNQTAALVGFDPSKLALANQEEAAQ